MTQTLAGPVSTAGQVLSVKRVAAFHVLTLVAPGLAERFRPGTFLAVSVGGAMSERLTRRTFGIHRVRPTGAHGGTVEVVLDLAGAEPGVVWLAAAPPGTPVHVVGPLGRPFALPKEPVSCLLVGDEAGSAPLFPLAERLKERGCPVQMLLAGRSDGHLFGALQARRSIRGVTVVTRDGSVGIAGGVGDVLPDLLARTRAEVVYAAGPQQVLREVAGTAERHGAWSQVAVEVPMPCATGLCQGCALPVSGEDGVDPDGARLRGGSGVPGRPGALGRARGAARGRPVTAAAAAGVDLRTEVAGLSLATPVMTAAGCGGTGRELAGFLDLTELGAFTTRTISLDPSPGAAPPRVVETPSGC